MAIPHILGLPMELIYLIFQEFSPKEVVPFAQTSQTALTLSLSIVDLGEVFKWACEDNNEQAMHFVLPSILHAIEKDPGMVFDALANACRCRKVKAVQLLIKAGVPVELPRGLSRYSLGPRFYNTPLGCAMRDSDPEVLDLLVDLGVDISTAVIHYSDPLAPYIPNPAPLHHAVMHGFIQLVRILLACGVDANQHDRFHRSMLSLAADYGHVEIVKLLLSRGADVQSTDYKGRAALSYATDRGYLAIVHLLLDAGAQINAADKNGCTPLMRAVLKNHDGLVRQLVQRGADIHMENKRGRTALSLAASANLAEIVQYLASRGADANHVSRSGRSPMCYAEERKRKEAIKALEAAGCRRTRCWRWRGRHQEHLWNCNSDADDAN